MYIFLSLGKRPLMENHKPGNLGGGGRKRDYLSLGTLCTCVVHFFFQIYGGRDDDILLGPLRASDSFIFLMIFTSCISYCSII